jgi:uncharacterized membrane protein YgcG
MTHNRRKQNGSGSVKAERNRIITFLRYALDDVGAVSDKAARHLQQAIDTLEEEARKEPAVLGVHDAGGT